MKKNKLMRLASILLVLCLLTTSVISGTFAKYVTSDSGFDVARVAKFGVVASVSGDLFGETYDAVGNQNKIISYDEDGGTVSAVAASGVASAKVVAPGTVGGTMKFDITGKPEVSTTINLGLPLNKAGAATNFEDTDIKLKAGTYGVMKPVDVTLTTENKGNYWTYSNETKKFTVNTSTTGAVYELVNYVVVGSDYLPIKWTVGGTTGIADVAAARTALQNALYGSPAVTSFAPNSDLSKSTTLTWTWAFTDNSSTVISEQDKMDTILGDLIAIAGGTISNSYVVVKDASGSDYTALDVASETNGAPSDNSVPAQTIYFAKKATSDASTWDATENVAVLTESFGASLTVTQVD